MAVVYHRIKNRYGSSILKLNSSAKETSFLNEQDGKHEEEQNDEEDIFREAEKMDENNELENEIKAKDDLNFGNAAASDDKRKWS